MEELYQRDVYGKTLIELGKQDPRVVVLDADLSSSTRTSFFAKEFPGRFFNMGIAEQNMMGTAAGLASCGKIVFASTFAMFATGRAWDQIRNSICYNNLNVKIVVTHAGLTVGPDGATHQALEDIALMRAVPNMSVIVPCDGPQAREAVLAAFNTDGPYYIRLGRAKIKTVENKGPFVLGKGQVITEGKQVAVVACGIMVGVALTAVENLAKKGINVQLINIHTVRPIDTELLVKTASCVKGMVVCEEHSWSSGLACAIEEVVSEFSPVKIKRIGVNNRFGQSGEPEELLKEYKLTSDDIEKAVMSFL